MTHEERVKRMVAMLRMHRQGHTFEAIGTAFDVSRQRAQQLVAQAEQLYELFRAEIGVDVLAELISLAEFHDGVMRAAATWDSKALARLQALRGAVEQYLRRRSGTAQRESGSSPPAPQPAVAPPQGGEKRRAARPQARRGRR